MASQQLSEGAQVPNVSLTLAGSIFAGAVGSAALYAGALWLYAAVGDFDGVRHLARGCAREGAPHAVDVDRLSGADFTLDRDVHGREEFVAEFVEDLADVNGRHWCLRLTVYAGGGSRGGEKAWVL